MQLLAECYHYRPFVLALTDNTGQVLAGIPLMEVNDPLSGKRWISLPFTDFCQPLALNESLFVELIHGLEELGRQAQIHRIQVRGSLPLGCTTYAETKFVVHTLALEKNPEGVFETFDKKFKQYSRKAERSGLCLTSTGERQDLDTFYQLHLQVRRKLGVPIQPKRFFGLLYDRIISSGLGQILIVSHQGKPISGAIVLGFNGQAMIKYSASDPCYLPLRCHYFTFWKCIEWACKSGFRMIDFGRTDIADQGLRQFKEGWGTLTEPLIYSYIGDAPSQSTHKSLQVLVRGFIQHSPPWVCRELGELLYQYAA